jgi:hypothetical protein
MAVAAVAADSEPAARAQVRQIVTRLLTLRLHPTASVILAWSCSLTPGHAFTGMISAENSPLIGIPDMGRPPMGPKKGIPMATPSKTPLLPGFLKIRDS